MQIESYYILFLRILLSKFFYKVGKALYNLVPASLSSLMSFYLLFYSLAISDLSFQMYCVFSSFCLALNLENYFTCLHLFPLLIIIPYPIRNNCYIFQALAFWEQILCLLYKSCILGPKNWIWHMAGAEWLNFSGWVLCQKPWHWVFTAGTVKGVMI